MARPAIAASVPSPPNPFSTRFVRPDNTAYRFPPGDDAASVSDRLIDQLSCRGTAAIIGPHGTGKSTLLHSLRPRLEQVFTAVHWIRLSSATHAATELRDWQRELRASEPQGSSLARCLVIDGFEQLSWVARQRLIWRSLRRRSRLRRIRHEQPPRPCLLVTAHRPQFAVGALFHTGWDEAIVRAMTEEKLASLPWPERRMMLQAAEQQATTMKCRQARHRNVRDYWFTLYDEYERLRSPACHAADLRRRKN